MKELELGTCCFAAEFEHCVLGIRVLRTRHGALRAWHLALTRLALMRCAHGIGHFMPGAQGIRTKFI